MVRWLAAWLLRLGIACIAVSAGAVVVGRVLDPPLTPLMALRTLEALLEGRAARAQQTWVSVDDVSPALLRAVIAAEDARFFAHRGIDWDAVRQARAWNARHPGRTRGASTITMQCARTAFLWPRRTWVRKAVETWFALLMEAAWSKRRILEVYVNLVEWGDGVYGAEAAARRWFGTSAARLSARQAALLAAVLPAPRRWDPAAPTAYVARRASLIARRATAVRLEPLGLAASLAPRVRNAYARRP